MAKLSELREALNLPWLGFNKFLKTATEADAKMLVELEGKGKKRRMYVLRAHARFNRERARRERLELNKS